MRLLARFRLLWLGLRVVSCASERDAADAESSAAPASVSPAASAVTTRPSEVATPSSSSSSSVSASASPPPLLTTTGDDGAWPTAERLAVGFPKPVPGARIYSKSRHLWIRRQAGDQGADWMGYLSLGDSVRLKDGDATKAYVGRGDGVNCKDWYAVEPRGFACTGPDATLDASDPEVVELIRTRANTESPWPYRYGESLGTPVTFSLPGEPGESATPSTAPKLFTLGPGGRSTTEELHPGSTVAFTDAFQHGGTNYLLTWDRGIVEAERVRPYAESPFHGVVLGPERKLPLAFVKADGGGDELRRNEEGRFEPLDTRLARFEVLELTGRMEKLGRERLHETRRGTWVRDAQVGVAREPAEIPLPVSNATGRKTWIDVSIIDGTLIAYEDRTPVYATLISPGRGGPPVDGQPTLKTASTPVGVFAVLGKFVTATMVSSTVSTFVHTEVQYPQNFEGPYSLHGAYWHDRWGQKKSAGCVNLSPIDARRLYAWTDPPVPEGWHGLKSSESAATRTVVSIHR